MAATAPQHSILIDSLRLVIRAADELAQCPQVDDIFLRAVEFARDKLGLERCAIFLKEADALTGTYGTNLQGGTTDEHQQRFLIDQRWQARLQALETSEQGWITVEEPHHEWNGETAEVVGEGWIVLTPIRSTQNLIGIFCSDSAIHGTAIDPALQELVAVFCLLLGGIIERKWAEHALAQERNLLRTLIDSMPDHIYAKDKANRLILGNRTLVQVAGLETSEQLIGHTVFDFYPRELAQDYAEDDQNVIQSGEPLINREERSIDRDGKPIWLLTTKIPLRDAQGNVTGLVGISRDITPLRQAQDALQTAYDELELRVEQRVAELSSTNTALQAEMLERQRAEAALQRERNLLRTLIDTVPAYVYIKDAQSRFVDVNAEAAHKVGAQNPAELIGKTDFDFYPHEIAAQYFADERAIIESRQPRLSYEETTFDYRAGQSGWLLTSKAPILNEQGEAVGIVGVGLEITEQKEFQKLLERERLLLRTLIDSVPDYIFAKDRDGRFILTNVAHAQATHAREPKKLIGRTAAEMFPPDLAATYDADDREVIRTGVGLYSIERVSLDMAGQPITVSSTKVPLRDGDGNITGTIGISRDITAFKRAQEALQASEERYRMVTELISDYAFSSRFEPDGKPVTEWITTGSFTRLTGYTPEEIDGIAALYHPDDAEAVQQQIAAVLRGQPSSHDCRIITKSGEIRWLRMRRQPVWDDQAQRVVRYYGVAEDITERKAAEAVQRESERLRLALEKEKDLGELKTKLMITISHEFRTPLSVAYASTELLEKFYERMNVNQRAEHLRRIQQQVRKLTAMLEEISLLIHSQFTQIKLNLESVSLRDLCETTIRQLSDFEEAHQRIHLNIDHCLPDLRLDARRMTYVLTNLFSNALKYSDQLTTVDVTVRQENGGILLQVQDQGIGIPEKELARVFEPFYRAGNVGTISGTGLGLSIVKEIVEQHRGKISIQSEVGQGTQVSVFLPKQ